MLVTNTADKRFYKKEENDKNSISISPKRSMISQILQASLALVTSYQTQTFFLRSDKFIKDLKSELLGVSYLQHQATIIYQLCTTVGKGSAG